MGAAIALLGACAAGAALVTASEPQLAPFAGSAGRTPAARTVGVALSAAGSVDASPIRDGGRSLPRFRVLPRPVSDGVALAAAPRLQLTLQFADGRPAAFSPVELHIAGAPLAVGVTDAQGRVSLPGSGAGGRLRIGGVGIEPVDRVLHEASGEQVATLPAGRLFRGRVLVQGLVPSRPLPISVRRTSEMERAAAAEDLGNALALDVPGMGGSRIDNARYTHDDGSFAFVLPETLTQVWVRVGGHWVSGGAETWRNGAACFDALDAQAVVRLWRKPSVFGRVVGTGDAPGFVEVLRSPRDAALQAERLGVQTDEYGLFELPLEWFDVGRQSLLAYAAGRTRRVVARFEVGNTSFDVNIGSIRPAALQRRSCTVVDADGEPVAGASIAAPGTALLDSAPTSPQGRARLEWPSDELQLTVRAPGYRSAQLAVGAAQTSVGVVLERTASLDVSVTRSDGGTLAGFHVLLEAAREPQAESLARPILDDTVLRRSLGSLCGPTAVRLDGIVPRAPVKLSVLDPAGRTCFRAESIELQPGEWRPIEATITDVFRRQEFLVLDEAGKPLEEASVIVTSGSSAGTAAYASNSALRIESLHPGPYDVRVDAPGYQRASFRDVWLDGQGPAREYVLEPARAKSASTCGIVVRRGN